jgi:phospholipase/carboxylesterase
VVGYCLTLYLLTLSQEGTDHKMDKSLEVLTIPSSSKPQGVIVALHGWGANAEDLAGLAPVIDLPNYLMLFPQAPFDHPNADGGKMWYDFQNPNSTQLAESRSQLQAYLASLAEMNIPTFLLGFSQGGAMTLDIGLDPNLEANLAGLISLSGYLHPNIPPTAIASPILIIHGTRDSVVPVIAAQSAKTTLTKLGAKVSYAEFPMGHEINDEAIALVRKFILENSLSTS